MIQSILYSFLRSLQSGRMLKYFMLTSFFLIFGVLFVRLDGINRKLKTSEKITIPLKNYRIIRKQKNKEDEKETLPGKGKVGSAGVVDFKKAYLGKILSIINKEKRYPSYEKRRGFEDKVTLTLTILPSGSISQWKILKKSSYPGFNTEAKRMMNAVLFPAFPEELNMKEITIRFSIIFRMEE